MGDLSLDVRPYLGKFTVERIYENVGGRHPRGDLREASPLGRTLHACWKTDPVGGMNFKALQNCGRDATVPEDANVTR